MFHHDVTQCTTQLIGKTFNCPIMFHCDGTQVVVVKNMHNVKLLMTSCKRQYEPQYDKTTKTTCASSEDTDQPRQPFSRIRLFAVGMKKPRVLRYRYSAQPIGSDQTGWMPRLIWVFAGRIGHFAGFVMLRLNYVLSNKNRKWDPLRAVKTFIRRKVGHTT